MSVIFPVMKYIGEDSDLQSLFNTHYSLSSGDADYWAGYASSPIFPVSEQPESDKFYLLYNYRDTYERDAWWHLTTDIRLSLYTNSVKLIDDISSRLRDMFKDYEFAAKRLNVWLGQQGEQGFIINWSRYQQGGLTQPPDQENGVMGRELRIMVNATVC